MPELSISDVFDANQAMIMALPGVVGVGIGEQDGRPCIRVMVMDSSAGIAGMPDQLDGYLVIVDESGEIRALDD
jgi:hypothetical protein